MMKKYLILIFALSISSISFAQTETLFGRADSFGGFGGPIIEFSNINGTLVGDVGGGGAMVINDFFVGGYGMGNDGASVEFEGLNYDIDFAHGGLWFGYTMKQYKLVHMYSSFKIGWGATDLKIDGEKKFDDNLLALSPEIGLEFNITNWFKLGVTGGYRYVSGLEDLPVLENDDFSSMTGALTFRFGGYGDYKSYNHRSSEIGSLDF